MLRNQCKWRDDRWRQNLKCFANLVSVAMASVGVKGHLSRLLSDESLWGSGERKGEGGGTTAGSQTNNIILFKHGRKSFSMSTLEEDRWMADSLKGVRSHKSSRHWTDRGLKSDIIEWFISCCFFFHTVLGSGRRGFHGLKPHNNLTHTS